MKENKKKTGYQRLSSGGGAELRFLVMALAALAVLSAFLVFPREAGAQNDTVTGIKITPGVGKLDVTWDSHQEAASYWTALKKTADTKDSLRWKTAGTSATYNDLTSGVSYSFRIQICGINPANSCKPPWSDFPWSGYVSATVKYNPPGAATGVSATAEVGSLTVSWNQASNADGYAVQWKSGSQSYDSSRQNTVSSGSTTTSDITGLTAGTEYTVRVTPTREHADDGTSGETKGTPKAATPGKVAGVSVSPPSRGASNLGKLAVSWTAITGATGFHVQWKSGGQNYDSSRQRTVSTGSATTDTITGLANGTEYTVRVRATNKYADDDGAWSDEDTGTTNAGPPAKVGMPTVTPGVGTLSVSWSSVSDVTGYKVQWRESGTQNWNEKTETGTTSTISTNLTSGTTYEVQVIAYNADGDGSPSESSTGIPKYATPARVTGVTVTPEAEQLSVSWTAVSDAENYEVQWKSGGQSFDSSRQNTVTNASSIITGLAAETEYSVQVRATRQHADPGPWSAEETGTPKALQPGQVTGVTAVGDGRLNGSTWIPELDVSWTAVTNASGYVVQWKSGNDQFDPSREHTVSGGNTLTYTIGTGLTAGTEYTVQVKAKRTNANDGDWSPTAKGTPKAEPPPPLDGTSITLTAGTEQLTVSWTVVTGADGYKVQWKSGSQNFDSSREHTVTSGTTTTYTIRGLQGGVEYTVQVMATKEHADDGLPGTAKGTPFSPQVTAPGGQQGGDDGGGDETPGGGGDDVRCPDYPIGKTAGDVERDRDPDTLVEFVQDALFGVKSILSDETEESGEITRLVECFGVAGDWMSGSVFLFAVTDEGKYFLAPKVSELAGTSLNLDITDKDGCKVAAEILRAARGEPLQCEGLDLLPDGDATGFVQYRWDNPADPDDDSEPGYEDRGEAPGNSPKLSYVVRITDEDLLPDGFIILGSGYYPDWEPPGSEPQPPSSRGGDGGGGCAVAGETSTSGSVALALFLILSVLLAVSADIRRG